MTTKTLSVYAGLLLGVFVVFSGTAGADPNRDTKGAVDAATLDELIDQFPPRPRLAAQQMLAKYGPPQEATSEQFIWHNVGPFKLITVTKAEHPHDFPLPHMDYLEHTIDYRVPAEKAAALAAYDGSLTFDRTRGEMSARCDLEGHNILTLNLAHDIVRGKTDTEGARESFGRIVVEDTMGKHPPYVEALQFDPPTKSTEFSDKPVIPGSPKREAEMGTEAKKSGDAEVLAFVTMINLNEVLAAAQAGTEKASPQVLEYAKKLHKEHGKGVQETLKLGQRIGVTPIETAAVTQLRIKGAEELGALVPLDGEPFGAAYIDAMIKGHAEVQDMIDNQLLKNAQSEAVKKHLAETRSHVAMHLDEAKKLQGGMSR